MISARAQAVSGVSGEGARMMGHPQMRASARLSAGATRGELGGISTIRTREMAAGAWSCHPQCAAVFAKPGRTDLAAARKVWMQSSTRSEEHTSELQSLMRISYAVFCLKKKNK